MWTALRSSMVNERFMIGKDFSFNDPQFTYNSPTDLFLRQLSKQSKATQNLANIISRRFVARFFFSSQKRGRAYICGNCHDYSNVNQDGSEFG